MNEKEAFDIILNANRNEQWLHSILNQLEMDINKNDYSIIVLNATDERSLLKEWSSKFASFIALPSLDFKLKDFVNNDIVLVNEGVILVDSWLKEISSFAYQTKETMVVTPLIINHRDSMCLNKIDLKKIRLHDHLWVKKYGKHCAYFKGELLECLDNCSFEEFISPGWSIKMNEVIFKFGYRQEICDTVSLYLNDNIIIDEIYNTYPEIVDNISLQNKLITDKKSLLYFLHADFNKEACNNIGGTQLHVKDLVCGVKSEYRVIVAARDGDYLRVTAYLEDEELVFKFYIGRQNSYPTFYDFIHKDLLDKLIRIFSIDIIHVHHTFGFSSEIYDIAFAMKIPLIITLHDFYMICPTIKMIDDSNLCCVGNDSKEKCEKCLNKLIGNTHGLNYIAHWRQRTLKILLMCDKIIVPSDSAKKIFSYYFPQISDNIITVEHGYDEIIVQKNDSNENQDIYEFVDTINNEGQCTKVSGWAYYSGQNSSFSKIYLEVCDQIGNKLLVPTYKHDRPDVANGNNKNLNTGFVAYIPNCGLSEKNLTFRVLVQFDGVNYSSEKVYDLEKIVISTEKKLRVAFIGGLNLTKGSQFIADIIENNSDEIDWYIFGGIDDIRLSNLDRANLTKTNFYHREDIQLYLNLHKIDLVIILSLCPETFCYTLSEAILYKKPVIVTNIGAIGDRTKKMHCGWTVSLENVVSDVNSILHQINCDSNEYWNVCKQIDSIAMRSLKDMNREYLKIYSNFNKAKCNEKYFDSKMLYNSWENRISIQLQHKCIDLRVENENKVAELQREMELIYSSRSYQLAKVLSKIWNVPNWKRG